MDRTSSRPGRETLLFRPASFSVASWLATRVAGAKEPFSRAAAAVKASNKAPDKNFMGIELTHFSPPVFMRSRRIFSLDCIVAPSAYGIADFQPAVCGIRQSAAD